MTRNTSTIASASVLTTSLIEARTNGVVSNGTTAFMPAGKNGVSRSSSSCTALAVARALAPVASEMAMPAAGWPLKRLRNAYVSAPSSTRATSRSLSAEPSGLLRTMTLLNCSGVCMRSCALMVAVSCWPSTAGVPPSWPTVTCAFWACTAAMTSAVVRP